MNENLIRRKLAINPIYFIPLNTFKLRIRHKNLITCIPSFLHTIISLHSLILLFKASFHICYKLLHLAQTINGKKSILNFFCLWFNQSSFKRSTRHLWATRRMCRTWKLLSWVPILHFMKSPRYQPVKMLNYRQNDSSFCALYTYK